MADGGVHAHVGARDPVRDGVVHGLVREHFAAFVERVQEGGRSLPRYVEAEFEAFLRCGVLASGFMRARCARCGHDRLVAFSCKGGSRSALVRPRHQSPPHPERSEGGTRPRFDRASDRRGRRPRR